MRPIVTLVLVGLWVVSLSTPVFGQSGTVLAVSPASANLYLNNVNTTELELAVTNAVSLQGFDLTLTYDPAVVTLDSWAQGGMLSPTAVVAQTNTPGFLRLAVVQLGGTPPSGDDVLLRLTFSGVAPGASAVTITNAEFTNGSVGGVTTPALEHGLLIVGYDSALLDQFTLTGEVSLQGQLQRAGVPYQLGLGQTYALGPYLATSTDQSGANLDFGLVVADSYIITTTQPRYLNLTADLGKVVTVSAEKTALQPIRLVAGNAVWTDNVIDAADASLVGASYGLTLADLEEGETLDGDVNFDGVVDLKDLALVAGNYDLSSATVYHDWEP
ncbi:MAG: hypothetical protein H0S79_16655 [Anaerolineaceae bacterium]|nr:hypothetical protein [Anaerolineaceae bacterium]